MKLLRTRTNSQKTLRTVVHDERAVKKAVKASIKEQKRVEKEAARLRAAMAQ